MRHKFLFEPQRQEIISNGCAKKDVMFEGVQPNFPMITQASDERSGTHFNMPSTAYVNFQVGQSKYFFMIKVDVDYAHKSKEPSQDWMFPIKAECPIDMVTYHRKLKINCSQIHNPTYTQSMYVFAEIAEVLDSDEMVDVYSDGKKLRILESHIVLRTTLRTAASTWAYVPGSFEGWTKTEKYVQIPMHAGNDGKLKVTEGLVY